jgi:hypothetical protein
MYALKSTTMRQSTLKQQADTDLTFLHNVMPDDWPIAAKEFPQRSGKESRFHKAICKQNIPLSIEPETARARREVDTSELQ